LDTGSEMSEEFGTMIEQRSKVSISVERTLILRFEVVMSEWRIPESRFMRSSTRRSSHRVMRRARMSPMMSTTTASRMEAGSMVMLPTLKPKKAACAQFVMSVQLTAQSTEHENDGQADENGADVHQRGEEHAELRYGAFRDGQRGAQELACICAPVQGVAYHGVGQMMEQIETGDDGGRQYEPRSYEMGQRHVTQHQRQSHAEQHQPYEMEDIAHPREEEAVPLADLFLQRFGLTDAQHEQRHEDDVDDGHEGAPAFGKGHRHEQDGRQLAHHVVDRVDDGDRGRDAEGGARSGIRDVDQPHVWRLGPEYAAGQRDRDGGEHDRHGQRVQQAHDAGRRRTDGIDGDVEDDQRRADDDRGEYGHTQGAPEAPEIAGLHPRFQRSAPAAPDEYQQQQRDEEQPDGGEETRIVAAAVTGRPFGQQHLEAQQKIGQRGQPVEPQQRIENGPGRLEDAGQEDLPLSVSRLAGKLTQLQRQQIQLLVRRAQSRLSFQQRLALSGDGGIFRLRILRRGAQRLELFLHVADRLFQLLAGGEYGEAQLFKPPAHAVQFLDGDVGPRDLHARL